MLGDEFIIRLAPRGDADYTGVTLLSSEAGGSSTVTIFLTECLAGGVAAGHDDEHATPEATPTSE